MIHVPWKRLWIVWEVFQHVTLHSSAFQPAGYEFIIRRNTHTHTHQIIICIWINHTVIYRKITNDMDTKLIFLSYKTTQSVLFLPFIQQNRFFFHLWEKKLIWPIPPLFFPSPSRSQENSSKYRCERGIQRVTHQGRIEVRSLVHMRRWFFF